MSISLLLPTTKYPITQYFGEHAIDYSQWGYIGHNGVDFGTPLNTPIYASADGQIDKIAFENGGYGNYVKVKHNGGEYYTYYCHLSNSRVRTVGYKIKAGELIAYSGNTGASTGPHLHWGLMIPKAINAGYKNYHDPLKYVGVSTEPEQPPITDNPTLPEVTPCHLEMTAIVDYVNVRSGPGTQYSIVGNVVMGDQVTIVEIAQPDIWGKLSNGNWVALKYAYEPYFEKSGWTENSLETRTL